MFGSFLNVFLNSIVMLLYYQYYHSFSFISFVILSFPCFVILALIALSEFLCVLASFSIFSDVGLLCYLLWTILYILLVFYLTFLQDVALFKVCINLYTYFTVRFMLTDFE